MRLREVWARTQFYRWPRRILETWRIWTGRYVQPDVHIAGEIGVNLSGLVPDFDVAATFEKGPVNKPVRITSWAQFEKLFGPTGSGAQQVEAFLRNGGQQLHVTRVVDARACEEKKPC